MEIKKWIDHTYPYIEIWDDGDPIITIEDDTLIVDTEKPTTLEISLSTLKQLIKEYEEAIK